MKTIADLQSYHRIEPINTNPSWTTSVIAKPRGGYVPADTLLPWAVTPVANPSMIVRDLIEHAFPKKIGDSTDEMMTLGFVVNRLSHYETVENLVDAAITLSVHIALPDIDDINSLTESAMKRIGHLKFVDALVKELQKRNKDSPLLPDFIAHTVGLIAIGDKLLHDRYGSVDNFNEHRQYFLGQLSNISSKRHNRIVAFPNTKRIQFH